MAPIFSNLRNFKTERDKPESYGIKSLDIYEIYHFDFSFFVVYRLVQKLQTLENVRATLLTLLVLSTFWFSASTDFFTQ